MNPYAACTYQARLPVTPALLAPFSPDVAAALPEWWRAVLAFWPWLAFACLFAAARMGLEAESEIKDTEAKKALCERQLRLLFVGMLIPALEAFLTILSDKPVKDGGIGGISHYLYRMYDLFF